MCVKQDGEILAPTMEDLWHDVRDRWNLLGEIPNLKFQHVLNLCNFRKLKLNSRELATQNYSDSIYGNAPDNSILSEKNNNIEKLLNNCIRLREDNVFRHKDKINTFLNHAKMIIAERVNFITKDLSLDYHENFIRKLISGRTPNNRLKIYTTNYDLSFEHAANSIQYYAVNGFPFFKHSIFDDDLLKSDIIIRDQPIRGIENLFYLYKLHGSVDWNLVA